MNGDKHKYQAGPTFSDLISSSQNDNSCVTNMDLCLAILLKSTTAVVKLINVVQFFVSRHAVLRSVQFTEDN